MNSISSMITVVTPCLNRRQYVEEAIQSVLQQDYEKLEHIIVDGGSTDGTLDVLRRYPRIRVISEPDQGVYDALNKGIRLARGEIIGHLNSDDFYERNVFAEVARRFAADPRIDAVCGGAVVFEDGPDRTRRTVAQYLAPQQVELSLHNITVGTPIPNARFFRRRVYDQVGLYESRYRLAADREFLLRVALAGCRDVSLDRVIYNYRQHGDSLTINGQGVRKFRMLDEFLSIAERYLHVDRGGREIRHRCRVWHARTAARGAWWALREKQYLEALRYGIRGWRYDPWWPLLVAWILVAKIGHFSLGRHSE